MRRFHIGFAAFVSMPLLISAGAATDSPTVDVSTVRQSFDVHAPFPPSPVLVGSERKLVYELHLTSFARDPLVLTELEILDDASGLVLGRLSGSALEAVLDVPGYAADARTSRSIEAGRRAIVYIDLPLASAAPAALRHRIKFEVGGSAGAERGAVISHRIAVDVRALPVLGPPLRGGPWVAVYDPRLTRGHRRVIYAVGGRATIPGRHAIDWMRPGSSERSAPTGDTARGAGAEVLAVADGVVASTRDGVPEPAAGAPRPRASLGDATGNYVSISIGGGRYAFYEHLMPGLLVKPGERVRRGQVIGRLGSTGQASRPHLHFHLADANSPLAAEGMPYVLAGAQTIGAFPSIAAFESGGQWTPSTNATGRPALPIPNAVVRFR